MTMSLVARREGVALAFLSILALAGCDKKDAQPQPPGATPPAATAKQVGEACSVQCGDGVVAAIQCAEGEKPVCDCNANPNASCVPQDAAARTQ